MADDKGGSDLDVFEGLAKKQPRSAIPGLTPPPQNQARRTLMGGIGGLPPPPSTLPGPGGALPPPPLPPPGSGAMPPPAPQGAAPMPPSGPLPPVMPPPMRGTLPPVTPPPRVPTSTPLPPPPPQGVATLPPVMPPPARPPAQQGEQQKARGKGPSVDMDWDDEEESTHVYDKQTADAIGSPSGPRPAAGMRPSIPTSAAALLASSGGAAAPAARVPTSVAPQHIPSTPPVPSAPPPQSGHPGHHVSAMPPPTRRSEEATAVRPRPVVQSGGSKAGVVLGGLALVAVIGLGVVLLLPKKGDLKIDVKAPAGTTIAKAEVFVDGQKRCDTVPCVVRGLESGAKTIKVIAPDLPPQDAAEVVEGNKEKLVLVDFSSAGPAAATQPAATTATGVKVASAQSGVKVFVDGAEKGTLPAELTLTPGAHKLRFEAGDRYEKREQSVDVTQGQMKDLGNVALKVVKGQVTLELVTQGAAVTLVNAKGAEKRLPDTVWKTPPVKLDIDPAEGWKLVAKKKGFDDFSQPLTFEDGQAEKTLRIELSETGKSSGTASGPIAAGPTPGPAPGPGPGPSEPKTSEPAQPQPPASGAGTLNINSIPVSKVVLDGRPLGSTPKVGVSVPAGSHTVTFIHPEHGKKSVTVTVKAGETKTAAVKFK